MRRAGEWQLEDFLEIEFCIAINRSSLLIKLIAGHIPRITSRWQSKPPHVYRLNVINVKPFSGAPPPKAGTHNFCAPSINQL